MFDIDFKFDIAGFLSTAKNNVYVSILVIGLRARFKIRLKTVL